MTTDVQPEVKRSNYQTGFCSSGFCFGTKKYSPSGVLHKTCQWKYEYRGKAIVCQCSCHAEFQEMLDMITQMAAENGGDAAWAMPTIPELQKPPVVIDDRPRPTPLTLRPLDLPFQPTPTGRAARGELEENVRRVVKTLHLNFPEGMTTDNIGAMIDRQNPPSTGAVHAVITRWESQGFCTTERRPFRIVSITERGERVILR